MCGRDGWRTSLKEEWKVRKKTLGRERREGGTEAGRRDWRQLQWAM